MKKVVLSTAAMLCVLFMSHAQDKKMSIGLGVGGGGVSSKSPDEPKDKGFGFSFYLNGMYNINANISAGIEYNSNGAIVGDFVNGEVSATNIKGILAKGRYGIGEDRTRPFVGVMAGLYSLQPGSITTSGTSVGIVFEKKRTFGFAPEIGIEIGSFQLATSYHIIGKYSTDFVDPLTSTTTTLETNYKIWQIGLGWNIGLLSN